MTCRAMTRAGDPITLAAKTLKGRNRIREHGDRWTVVFVCKGMAPLSFSSKTGTWLLVIPEHDDPATSHARRWVHLADDDDFDVTTTTATANDDRREA